MTSPTPIVMRFVVLEHDHPRGLHWDFMLESAGVLKTWALSQPPEPGTEQSARALGDHRIAYLDYEGPLSADPLSGDRGTVSQWDAGQCVWLLQSAQEMEVALTGRRLIGRARLLRLENTEDEWRIKLTG